MALQAQQFSACIAVRCLVDTLDLLSRYSLEMKLKKAISAKRLVPKGYWTNPASFGVVVGINNVEGGSYERYKPNKQHGLHAQ